jgi:CheY-like chemotaxis protein/two-component sensor histidine kinase
LMDTLNKILDITKLEFDKLEPKYDSVDLKQLITELRDNFLVTAQNQNTFISTSFNTETLLAKSDEKLLTEILNNLINNAVKYTINGLIEIKTEVVLSEQHNLCIIKVIDNGIGIPEEKINLIWDEFRQVSEGFNRTFEGTGLGLSITKKYVELLGGKISVESKVDKGTVFTIELPFVAADNLNDKTDPDTETIPIKKSKGGIKPKILYVEDEGITLLYVQKILSDYYDVDTADNATAALEKISKNYYAALLLDINLKKGIDGVKLMEIIRGNTFYKTIPIAAITAFATTNDKIEFLNRGFSHYLPKPFTSDDIYRLLDSMFSKH